MSTIAVEHTASTITTRDGTQIYYKDWGKGPVVTFSHGWPLNSDAWDGQMLFLAQNGFRAVAHDRRGHGRSSQVSSGNDMDSYADDLAAVIEALDLNQATLVAHSTGGGEVARYIGRHGTARVAKVVLISAIPPGLLKTRDNPEGLPIELFDGLRAGLMKDRSQFYRDFAVQFYGTNRSGANVSQGILDQFWSWSMQSGLKNSYDCSKALSETDFTEDLKKFDVPTLVMHAGDDQVVPVHHAERSAKLIKGAKVKIYPGAPHGLTATHQDQVNADLLAFLKEGELTTVFNGRLTMKIVVIGGTGLIGSKLVTKLREQGHDVVAASPNSGVNTITGEGVADALRGASVVVDVSNSPSLEDAPALAFFETSTRNLLAAETEAGVGHHVALSVVGTERLLESGYFRAKIAQEKLIKGSSIPYSIVHATQFFEFFKSIAAAATDGNTVRLAPVLIQPMAADDVADAVEKVAVDKPLNDTIEVAGPEPFRLDEFIRQGLSEQNDPREVVADPEARYFGALLTERTLVPRDGARLSETRFEEWLGHLVPQK